MSPKFQTYEPGQHVVQGLPFKAHRIDSFSPEMLEHHYEKIYGGAVRRLNEIEKDIVAGRGDANALLAEHLKVANSIILHEIYFESFAEDGGEPLTDSALQGAIDASFGGIDNWQAEFLSMAVASKDGWMVLAWSDRFGRLMNFHLADDAQAVSGADPLLVLDLDEHAHSADFGTDRKAYAEAFIKGLHWGRISRRFQCALGADEADEEPSDASQISVAELKNHLDNGDDVLVLDVRHDDDRERYRSRIMETEYRDSFNVGAWANDLPKDKPVVVYCMYGFWVSQKAAEELREQGIDARSLSGGVTAWRAMGYASSENLF